VVGLAVAAGWLWPAGRDRPAAGEAPAPTAAPAVGPGGQRPVPPVPTAGVAKAAGQAAQTAPGPNRPSAGTVVWGSGPGQLGRERQEEGNAEGPMALAVGPGGEAWVLDTVNGRLQRLERDGGYLGSQPLAVQYAQDVAVLPDGRTLQLDRLVDQAVAVVAADGRLLGELPLAGPSLEKPGGVTGLFVDGEDVYVEKAHGTLVRVGDTAGNKDAQQPEVPGRPSRDGASWLSAGIVEGEAGRLYVTSIRREPLGQRFTRELRVPPVVLRLMWLDSDASGVIHLAWLWDGGGAGPQVTLACLGGEDGRVLGQRPLPASNVPEETFREFALDPAGGALYAWRTEAGVQLLPVDCRTP
jgi:hypothetical protein